MMVTKGKERFIFTVFSGLCFLPACFPRVYIPVQQAVTWAEAQSFCRWKYTDLAAVGSSNEMSQLLAAAQKYFNSYVWIGLYDDINSWRWSLQRGGFYGAGESTFRMWSSGEPNDFAGAEDCAQMGGNGMWNDFSCQGLTPFVCYNGSGITVDPANYIFVPVSKTWSDAQSYCRQFYTDLASVRNLRESAEVQKAAQNQVIWIGLYRDSWKWSDGSPLSFTRMNPPIGTASRAYISTPCVILYQGQWFAYTCVDKLFFVCYDVPVTRQIVRMKVTKTDPALDLEVATEAVMQKFVQTVTERSLSGNVTLTWRRQHDGKTFSLLNTVKEEQPACDLND